MTSTATCNGRRSLGNIIKAGLGPGTSPVLYEDLVIVQCDQEMGAGSFIAALDRRTGKEVWRVDRKNRRSWATPLLVRSAIARSSSPRAPSR